MGKGIPIKYAVEEWLKTPTNECLGFHDCRVVAM